MEMEMLIISRISNIKGGKGRIRKRTTTTTNKEMMLLVSRLMRPPPFCWICCSILFLTLLGVQPV